MAVVPHPLLPHTVLSTTTESQPRPISHILRRTYQDFNKTVEEDEWAKQTEKVGETVVPTTLNI